MTASEWIITCLGSALTVIMAVAGYFIAKWIASVDESITKNSQEIRQVGDKVKDLSQVKTLTTENISQTVRYELGAQKGQLEKIDKLGSDIDSLRRTTQDKILPQIISTAESVGKVTVIEKKMGEQELKLIKLFSIVKLIAVRGVGPAPDPKDPKQVPTSRVPEE